MKNKPTIIRMSDVQAESVKWLWEPYIPLGKTTIIHGDPGEGKTHLALALIAALTRGDPLPMCSEAAPPMNVIYQTAEDGLRDTIKPRLEASGADCSRVFAIDDGDRRLTLLDERVEAAIRETNARLIVLDPLQAFVGGKMDMNRANKVRPLMKSLGDMARRTGCAVLLVSHINKARGTKAGYRGLGPIDITASELLDGTGQPMTKVETMEDELLRLLIRPLPATYIIAYAKNIGVSERTVNAAKKHLGIVSEKRADGWYWRLPDDSEFPVGA